VRSASDEQPIFEAIEQTVSQRYWPSRTEAASVQGAAAFTGSGCDTGASGGTLAGKDFRRNEMGRGLALALLVACFAIKGCIFPRPDNMIMRFEQIDLRAETSQLLGASCMPERISLDPATSASVPEREPDAEFPGEIYGLRVFVWLNEEGSYDYREVWSAGLPPWWELVPLGQDWKTGCQLHSCELPDGRRCCWQQCTDGGDHGFAWEGPDQFTCMNASTGAIFQWYLEGLARSGVEGIDGCE
jgi:hypothetical protein